MINKIFMLIAIAIFFSACIDINLKSELPKNNYYKLDNIEAKNNNCEAYNLVALVGIDLPKEYQNSRILYKENNKIKYFENTIFIRNTSQSLESMLIKNFDKQCIKIILPPFSGINLESFLSIKILDFDIIKDETQSNAVINLFYQITQQGQVWQSGIISQSENLQNFNEKESIKALQEISLKAINELANKIIPK